MDKTLPAFTPEQFKKAHLYLATRVAEMSGRKLEEDDWSSVYCEAKGIPKTGWSNLSIDVAFQGLGVEHKMICRRSRGSILDACGTRAMHPAGTRAIRIPDQKDPLLAAQDILEQYRALIDRRSIEIDVLNRYNHFMIERDEALLVLEGLGMSAGSARNLVPTDRSQTDRPYADADMRIGWLLWQDTLREFLYFENRMSVPDPDQITAEWNQRGDGRRRGSRNLWIYDKATSEKIYSVTTEAGAKIQPYFKVPLPSDPNLYHFVVQGESLGEGMVRAWITGRTAGLLEQRLGNLSPDTLRAAVNAVTPLPVGNAEGRSVFEPVAVAVSVSTQTYEDLQSKFEAVSDEHLFRQLLDQLPD
jgi:hypothetical protein